ncbi:hypothetical protein SacN8_02420 [Sulfolobus acidocaldarius N8]|uniref:Uncharacterized protein n=2 Tax=Sulfolobus acidocaldarius TaxID=2285 RepID=M1IAA3_9CREN|nr:hypothetical protein SacN8_02420 [Sulfolobus acidocaldarius N8]AGE72738.1 hypothetical protein SacRon12I_02415 [Sulfolobus acidocaldarius Ron12/I]
MIFIKLVVYGRDDTYDNLIYVIEIILYGTRGKYKGKS